MKQRMFTREPGQLRFTEDFQLQARGSVLPGQPLDIEFADSRIPEEPTGLASIDACFRFDSGEAMTVPLRLRSGWRTIETGLTEPGEGNLWVGTVMVPAGASAVSVWFEKTGPSGSKYYDSQFGENYWFRFAEADLNLLEARVDGRGLHLAVEATPDITAIDAHYHVLNRGLAEGDLQLWNAGAAGDGMIRWTGTAPMDPDAVVSFVFTYVADGRTFTDDNQRRNYLAPDPEAVLSARRASASAQKS